MRRNLPFYIPTYTYDLHSFKYSYSKKRILIVLNVVDTLYSDSLQT